MKNKGSVIEEEEAGIFLPRDMVNFLTGKDGSAEKVCHVLCLNTTDNWEKVTELVQDLYGKNVKISYQVVRDAKHTKKKGVNDNRCTWIRIMSVFFIGETCCVALSGKISDWDFPQRTFDDENLRVVGSRKIRDEEEGYIFPMDMIDRITGADGDWNIAGSVTGFNEKNNWTGSRKIIEEIYGDEKVSGISWQCIGSPGASTVMQHDSMWMRIRDIFFFNNICHLVGSGQMSTWQFPFRMHGPRPFNSLYGIDPLPYMCM